MQGDNAAAKERESGSTPTNRNFPESSEDLAAAQAAGKGTAVDASKKGGKRTREILPENILLLQLLERFKPERIISIHGTWRAGAGGVFFDPRSLTDAEVAKAQNWANAGSPFESLALSDDPKMRALADRRFRLALFAAGQNAVAKDEDLSRRAALAIDSGTSAIADRDQRSFGNREDDPAKVPSAEVDARKAHPSVAGNVGKSGNVDRFSWSGGVPNGVSLGEYAAPRGMSVFTVEPPINANTDDYASGKTADKVTEADRKTELQSYADAVRTVLLGQ